MWSSVTVGVSVRVFLDEVALGAVTEESTQPPSRPRRMWVAASNPLRA